MAHSIPGVCPVVERAGSGMNVTLTARPGEVAGVSYLDVDLTWASPQRPGPVTLRWDYPVVDVHQRTCSLAQTKLCGMGRPRTRCSTTHDAPVWCMFNYAGTNALTFALSDAIRTSELSAQCVEETACLTCRVELLLDPVPSLTRCRVTIRFDSRRLPYEQVLRDVSDWWAAMEAYRPATVPEHARLPMYSTWYSFHLDITPAAIEAQCALARSLGMESVIVDDGWQTDDRNRGYAWCGDWEPASGKFPDFRAHVDRVHALGMKYLLWFSVPFVGVRSRAFQRFEGRFLDPDPEGRRQWFVLDPRFPDVREHLIGVYERSLRAFDLDGFKLDFVDCFETRPLANDAWGGGRDYDSVPEAADRLLADVLARLRAIKPDVMIEFRQPYTGPAMRRYGNIFRVGDEPAHAAGNRVGSMLLRALAGGTAVHSDMVMWHPKDTVHSAAMQLIHALFCVPQLSVRLDAIPADHLAMIRRYLAFWREHRDVLLDGRLRPLQPQHAYPAVVSESQSKVAAAAYANGFVPLPPLGRRTLLVVNGTFDDRVVVELPESAGRRRVRVWTCTGSCVVDEPRELAAGPIALPLPPAGAAELTPISV